MSDPANAAWKLARDRYLGPLVKAHGEQVAWDAGFFLDDDPTDAPLDDVDWLCTPLPNRRARTDAPKVLLATGGFFPLHAGHLAMMEAARRAAEHAGWEIIGGYLSPGHDNYLRLKCGDAAAPASERLRLVGRGIADANSDWLRVDPWEALHRRGAVNYTDVAARLEAYLRAHVHPQLTVVYVCGGDNARFASAFVARGGCIVVGRPGAETEWSRWRATLAGHPGILFAEGGSPLASRDLRATTAVRRPLPSLLVRCEDARVVDTLGLAERLPAFQDQLLTLLRSYTRVRVEQGPPEPVTAAQGVISLDPLRPARFNLALSRLFAVGGYQPLGHVARPGHPPLARQIAGIPPGEYRLRDDDAMSGSTLEAVRRALPAHVHITATELALARHESEDVLDARDFLLGADEGGLVLAWPDAFDETPRLARAPYLLPYVDPCVRASIPDARGFSSAVWELNARFFAQSGRKVADLPAPARAMFAFAGTDASLEDLCRWHAARLATFAPVDNPPPLRPG